MSFHELFVVSFCEFFTWCFVRSVGFATEHAGSTLACKRDVSFTFSKWIVCKRSFGICHVVRVIKNDNLAHIVNTQFFKRFHHCPCEPARIECIVVVNCGSLKHEPHATIWQIQTDGHFCVSLVGAISHSEPTANLGSGVEAIDIHAFVEVGLWSKFMHVFIGWFESNSHVFPPNEMCYP